MVIAHDRKRPTGYSNLQLTVWSHYRIMGSLHKHCYQHENRNMKMQKHFFLFQLYSHPYLEVKTLAKWQDWCIISCSLLPFALGLVEDKSLGYCSSRPHESDGPPWWEIKGFLMGRTAGTYCICEHNGYPSHTDLCIQFCLTNLAIMNATSCLDKIEWEGHG